MSAFTQFVLNHPGRFAMPILTYPGGTLTGVQVRDMVTEARAQVAAQVALRDRYGLQVLLSAMDLSAEAEAFGCEIMMGDDDPPTVTGQLVTNAEAAQALAVPEPGAKRTQIYLDTVRRLKALPGAPLVLAGMLGPFSLAGRLCGVSESLQLTLDDPDLVHRLLEKSTQFLVAYAQAFKAAGADGVVVAEPTAGLLSPRMLGSFSSPYVKRIVQAVDDDRFTLILHNCGARLMHLPFVLESGAKVFHFGAPMDLPAALSQVKSDIILCGNLDPAGVLVQSTPDGVRAAARKLLDAAKPHRNFVLSSGCDVPARAPLANVDALFQAAAED